MNAKQKQLDSFSFIPDKWLLSSALHKLIRRGQSVQSIAIALRLHATDPAYLRRRLPIIALEDIGVGELSLCKEVITVCSSKKWWQENSTATITSLVSRLAMAVKSRAACDAFCLTESHMDRSLLQTNLLKVDQYELVDIASCKERPQLDRLIALRVMGGITMTDGSYRRLSKLNVVALDLVAKNLGLSDTVRWLIACNAKTLGMAAMLPVVCDLVDGAIVKKGEAFPYAMSMVNEIPFCAWDMYTRAGKFALKQFYLSSPALQDFLHQQAPRSKAIQLINTAMFQIESSSLDQYSSTHELDKLKKATDDAEILSLGMTDISSRFALYDLLWKSAEELARARLDYLGLDPSTFDFHQEKSVA